jgi:hypothetical protein
MYFVRLRISQTTLKCILKENQVIYLSKTTGALTLIASYLIFLKINQNLTGSKIFFFRVCYRSAVQVWQPHIECWR